MGIHLETCISKVYEGCAHWPSYRGAAAGSWRPKQRALHRIFVVLQGYDATSHFETEIHDVLDMYRRITGGRTAALYCLYCICSVVCDGGTLA